MRTTCWFFSLITCFQFSAAAQTLLWSEGWEGSMTNYSRYDANDINGLDYWGTVACDYHSGSLSLWCAAIGDRTVCQEYDNNQSALIETINGIDLQGHTSFTFTFWVKYNMETNYDRIYFKIGNGADWTTYWQASGNSNGWIQQTVLIQDFQWTHMFFRFDFESDDTQHDLSGVFLDDLQITSGTTDILDHASPHQFLLHQNLPNPFNPTTTIKFFIPENAHTSLTIYNTLGQRVETLVDEVLTPGEHAYVWTAKHSPSGVYYYRLISKDNVKTRKLLLLK